MKSFVPSILFFLVTSCIVYMKVGSTSVTDPIPKECKNEEGFSCDEKLSQCDDQKVRDKCGMTCRVCSKCYDYVNCTKTYPDIWKACNEYENDVECQVSCRDCDLQCGDRLATPACKIFVDKGLCKDTYIKGVCKVSCGICEPACQDILPKEICDRYKSEDLCQESDYAQKYCNKTCADCKPRVSVFGI